MTGTAPTLEPEGSIVLLSYSFGGGMRNDYRSYTLREENGEVLLDAQYNFGSHAKGQLNRMDFKGYIASAKDLEDLNVLAEDCEITAKTRGIGTRSRAPGGLMLRDGDPRADSLDVVWENGARLMMGTNGCSFCMDIFFEALANRIALPPAEGRVAALYLRTRDYKEYYTIMEKDGQFELRYKLPEEAPGNVHTISIDAVAMDTLRAICEKYGFPGMQQTYRPVRACYHKDYPKTELHMVVEWENSARLVTPTAFGGEDELWRFFRALSG